MAVPAVVPTNPHESDLSQEGRGDEADVGHVLRAHRALQKPALGDQIPLTAEQT